MEKRRYFSILPDVSLYGPADLRIALQHAFPEAARLHENKVPNVLATSSRAIDAAAKAQLKRLADPQITELDRVQRDLEAISRHAKIIIDTLKPEVIAEDAASQVARVTRAKTPPSAVVSAIESGARAAGHDNPTDTLDEALRQVANLHLWADAAARAFEIGRSTRERAERHSGDETFRCSPIGAALLALTGKIEDPPMLNKRPPRTGTTPAHTGRELGLVVIATYAALTGRPVRVSRRNATKAQRGGEVTGPLVRFVLATFDQIRDRLAQESTLQPFGTSRAFNPTAATIALWAREYNRVGKARQIVTR